MATSTERTRKHRERKKSLGLCYRCGFSLTNHAAGCLESHSAKNNELYHKRHELILELYGKQCCCCGESDVSLLTIDHVQNDGGQERKKLSQRSFYAKLANAGCRLNGYQLLCWNCNCSKNLLGECAHIHKFDKPLTNQTRWYRKLKQEILSHYGGQCLICQETNLWFLTIDHPNGGGRKERQKVGSGSKFYRWLKSQKFPDGYRVLCFNCNCRVS